MMIETMMKEFFETIKPKIENFESFKRTVETEIEDAIINTKKTCNDPSHIRKQSAIETAMNKIFKEYYFKYEIKNLDNPFNTILNSDNLVNLQLLGVPVEKMVDVPIFEVNGIVCAVSCENIELSVSALHDIAQPHLTLYDLLLQYLQLHYAYVYEVKELETYISPKDFSRIKTFEVRGVKNELSNY